MKRLIRFFLIIGLTIPIQALADKPILSIDTNGHMGIISEVMFTSDGKNLVSASKDKTIRVWDTSTGEIVRTFRGQVGVGHEGVIYASALSPDDRILAIGGWMGPYPNGNRIDIGTIRLFDFQSGEIMDLFKGHRKPVLSLDFSPDGSKLVSGSFDKTVRIWDIHSGKTVHTLKGHRNFIYAVAFSPDGTRVASGSNDNKLKLWDVKTGSLINTLNGHTNHVRDVSFTLDGKYILSCSEDKTIRLWNGRTGSFIKVLATFSKRIDGLSISPDSSKVVVGNLAETGPFKCHTLSIPSGKKMVTFSKNTSIVRATDISPDGSTVATAGGNSFPIYLWDITTGRVKQKLAGKGSVIWSVGFAKDGRSIAWGNTNLHNNVFKKGPLEQSFQLKGRGEEFNLSIGQELRGGSSFVRTIESAGSWSIRTKKGHPHPTLEILNDGRQVHKITRGPTDGYGHTALTITSDGQTVISGGGHGVLTSYNSQTGKKIHDFVGHTGDVLGVSTTPDNRFLVSGSGDQTVRLWEIDTGKLLLTIFQTSDNEWVAWIPEGYYTSSFNGSKYVGWHLNRGEDKSAIFYPVSRFAKQFYSPEIVTKYLETSGDIDEAIRLVNLKKPRRKKIKATTTSDLVNILPPMVFFQIPSKRDVTVKQDRVRVKAVAKSANNEPITDIWLLINGRRLDKIRGIKIQSKESKKIVGLYAEINTTVPLTQTDNRLSVIASNKYTQSEPSIVNVRWQTKAARTVADDKDIYKPNLYLLSMGISKYQQPGYALDYAHRDAEGLASVLSRQSGKLYREVHKRVLTNEKATKGDILDGLDWILKQSTQKNLSVIFVAGHGLKDNLGNYYFLPHDGNPDKLRRTGVKWFDFQDVLSSLPSKVIFLVDTCHSGSVTGKRRGTGEMTDALRELVNAESGVVVMTASTGKEKSQERPEWRHGAFTKALIEGLEGNADYDKDNMVDVKEIDLFITKRVKELTNGGQHPTTEIPKTMPNFPLVYN